MTNQVPEPPTRDPLERVIEITREIQSHSERIANLPSSLSPEQTVALLKSEFLETVVPLFQDFSSAVSETLQDERDYIMEEIVPEVFGDDPEETEEEEDSMLVVADAVEFTALFAGYRAALEAQLAVADNQESAEMLRAWIDRCDRAVERVQAITEEPEEPEKPEASEPTA